MDKDQTMAIKGIFAIIIFFSHFNSYIQLASTGEEKIYSSVINGIGQLMVTLFLFYSGYGIYCSVNKKENYIKNFPKTRILKTLLNFDIAVLLFWVLDLILVINYEIKDVLLAFTSWTSIGNSNWFIFAILVMYLSTYLVAKLNKNKINKKSIIIITMFSIIYIILMRLLKTGESWWYDTILCYPLGLLYGMYKEKIDNALRNRYIFVLMGTIILFTLLYIFRSNLVVYELLAIVFCLLVVFITYKFKISNKILKFLGKYSFEIYILQRLPDLILKEYLLDKKYIFFFTSLACTIVLAIVYKKITNLIDKKLVKDK